MTDHTTAFPLPPGVNEDDVNAPTSALVDFGTVLTLYVGMKEWAASTASARAYGNSGIQLRR